MLSSGVKYNRTHLVSIPLIKCARVWSSYHAIYLCTEMIGLQVTEFINILDAIVIRSC